MLFVGAFNINKIIYSYFFLFLGCGKKNNQHTQNLQVGIFKLSEIMALVGFALLTINYNLVDKVLKYSTTKNILNSEIQI